MPCRVAEGRVAASCPAAGDAGERTRGSRPRRAPPSAELAGKAAAHCGAAPQASSALCLRSALRDACAIPPGDATARATERGWADATSRPDQSPITIRKAYYATAFHEAAHSTGAPSRLNRPGVAGFDHFGSGRYAREELVAEIGGAMLCTATGVATEASLRDDSAAYIAGWLKALGDDRRLVVLAASQAERASDRVLEPQRQAQPETTETGPDEPEAAASARQRLTTQWSRTARPHLSAEPEAGR
jgi:Zincin-like metallopeptidase